MGVVSGRKEKGTDKEEYSLNSGYVPAQELYTRTEEALAPVYTKL